MMNSNLIEKYFSNKLSDKERLEFYNSYKTNPDFKKEVDFLKDVKLISKKEDEAQFKQQLISYEAELSNQKKMPLLKWIKPLSAVAAIFFIAISIYFFTNNSVNEDALFTEYFDTSKNVSSPIVRSTSNESIQTNAFIAYNEANYKKSLPLFESAYLNTKNSELLFYQGNALLALGKTDEAILKFKQHLGFTDILRNRSHWYLALAYLKNKNVALAKQELELLLNTGDPFKKEEASSLLKKLK